MSLKAIRNIALASVAACVWALPASAATIVNLDGIANASQTGSNAITVSLAAGIYNISFVEDQYKSFSRWNKEVNCDSAGLHCRQGWENSARYIIGSETFYFGDGTASGGYGPVTNESAWFQTQELSFANALGYSAKFTLAEATDVKFFIYDNNISDNRGGVSLSISAVPEPATWAMLIAGFGLVGMASRRRRTQPGAAFVPC